MMQKENMELEERKIEFLEYILSQGGINTSEWESPLHKSVEDLMDEINKKETILLSYNGILTRHVYVSKGNVYYKDTDGIKYKLKEDKHTYLNGMIKERNLSSSMSEKSPEYESSEDGIRRGIYEELQLTNNNIQTIIYMGQEVDHRLSSSYPGLRSYYILSKYEVFLQGSEGEINIEEGFKEVLPEKTISFIWEKVDETS